MHCGAIACHTSWTLPHVAISHNESEQLRGDLENRTREKTKSVLPRSQLQSESRRESMSYSRIFRPTGTVSRKEPGLSTSMCGSPCSRSQLVHSTCKPSWRSPYPSLGLGEDEMLWSSPAKAVFTPPSLPIVHTKVSGLLSSLLVFLLCMFHWHFHVLGCSCY